MVEESGVEPPSCLILPCSYHASLSVPLIPVAHSVRPAFQLPPSCRETLPGSFVNPVFYLKNLTHGNY